jgi:hypothetical protein
MPTQEQTNLAPRASARDNQFSLQVFFALVVGDILLVAVVVDNHVSHFTAVFRETLRAHW